MPKMSKLVVVALGGNALLRSNQKGTYQEQIANVTETCQALADFLKRGHRLLHDNILPFCILDQSI